MSQKERDRKVMLEGVKAGQVTLLQASKGLKLSYRQIKRIYKRWRESGDEGLIHKNCGQRSHRAYEAKSKVMIVDLYRTKYSGFGPTLACEKLAKEGYPLSDETLRLWLIEEGLWKKQRKRNGYRKRRTRRERFGELLQLDGSHHCWFGKEMGPYCLMNLVDDATGTTLALLTEQETTEAAMKVLQQWIKRYGVPQALYVDLKGVYVSWKDAKRDAEELEKNEGFTHFSRACEKLGIEIIKAYSPQGKGRVERSHKVYQDRFVKELRLKEIKTLEGANQILSNYFVDELNLKFAKSPRSHQDGHRKKTGYGDLEQIFCWTYKRQLQLDWTVNFEGVCYQIAKHHPLRARPKQSIEVRKHLDGSITFWFKEQRLSASAIEHRAKAKTKEKKGYDAALLSKNSRKNKYKTPWNQYNPGWLKGREKSKTRMTSTN
jgi:hypothetical protein